jgi:hypothetical protein
MSNLWTLDLSSSTVMILTIETTVWSMELED